MSPNIQPNDQDMTPEAVLARAAAARGDVFPEWKILAYAAPQTYELQSRAGGYLHQYHGEHAAADQLSGPMRELIATPALCAKLDLRHAPNHIRRMYRMGLTNRVIMEAAAAFSTVSGWSTVANVGFAIMEANSADYPFGKLPEGGEPKTLTPFPELEQGRKRRSGGESLLDQPDWRYAAGIDPELARRIAAWVDHCRLGADAGDALLGPGPRELIVVAALAMRGDTGLAAESVRRAYDCGMTKRQVLDAISSIIPMCGIVSAQCGLRAMQLADAKGAPVYQYTPE